MSYLNNRGNLAPANDLRGQPGLPLRSGGPAAITAIPSSSSNTGRLRAPCRSPHFMPGDVRQRNPSSVAKPGRVPENFRPMILSFQVLRSCLHEPAEGECLSEQSAGFADCLLHPRDEQLIHSQ